MHHYFWDAALVGLLLAGCTSRALDEPDDGSAGGAGTSDGAAEGGASGAGGNGAAGAGAVAFKVFDQIPQFGIYATTDPDFTPPDGVVSWSFGTVMLVKLEGEQKARIGSTLAARITYHAQCDDYDRLGSVFVVAKAPGEMPAEDDPRLEIVRYITPFSDYRRGALATYVFPDADVSAQAGMLADSSRDIWVGIQSGANPYDGDPCTGADVTPEFSQVGYNISLEFVTSGPPPEPALLSLFGKNYSSETALPVTATFTNPGEVITGHVTVIVSGHGSDANGVEYSNSHDTVSLGDDDIGDFDTSIDCADYAAVSPDGNQGIFHNNSAFNPRNWCPGALVPSHSFEATLEPGDNTVTLSITPSSVPDGSYYSTTINFTSP
jgi:hypothetical protein